MLIQGIDDLYSYFLKNKHQTLPVLGRNQRKNNFLGLITKADLLRTYNNPLKEKKKVSQAINHLIKEVCLDDFVEKLSSDQIEGIGTLVKIQKNFELVYYSKSEFLIEFKIAKKIPFHDLGQILQKHQLPIMILNKLWQPIYQNEAISKLKDLGNIRSLARLIEKSDPFKKSSKALTKKIEGRKMTAHFQLQNLVLQDALVYLITFIRWKQI